MIYCGCLYGRGFFHVIFRFLLLARTIHAAPYDEVPAQPMFGSSLSVSVMLTIVPNPAPSIALVNPSVNSFLGTKFICENFHHHLPS